MDKISALMKQEIVSHGPKIVRQTEEQLITIKQEVEDSFGNSGQTLGPGSCGPEDEPHESSVRAGLNEKVEDEDEEDVTAKESKEENVSSKEVGDLAKKLSRDKRKGEVRKKYEEVHEVEIAARRILVSTKGVQSEMGKNDTLRKIEMKMNVRRSGNHPDYEGPWEGAAARLGVSIIAVNDLREEKIENRLKTIKELAKVAIEKKALKKTLKLKKVENEKIGKARLEKEKLEAKKEETTRIEEEIARMEQEMQEVVRMEEEMARKGKEEETARKEGEKANKFKIKINLSVKRNEEAGGGEKTQEMTTGKVEGAVENVRKRARWEAKEVKARKSRPAFSSSTDNDAVQELSTSKTWNWNMETWNDGPASKKIRVSTPPRIDRSPSLSSMNPSLTSPAKTHRSSADFQPPTSKKPREKTPSASLDMTESIEKLRKEFDLEKLKKEVDLRSGAKHSRSRTSSSSRTHRSWEEDKPTSSRRRKEEKGDRKKEEEEEDDWKKASSRDREGKDRERRKDARIGKFERERSERDKRNVGEDWKGRGRYSSNWERDNRAEEGRRKDEHGEDGFSSSKSKADEEWPGDGRFSASKEDQKWRGEARTSSSKSKEKDWREDASYSASQFASVTETHRSPATIAPGSWAVMGNPAPMDAANTKPRPPPKLSRPPTKAEIFATSRAAAAVAATSRAAAATSRAPNLKRPGKSTSVAMATNLLAKARLAATGRTVNPAVRARTSAQAPPANPSYDAWMRGLAKKGLVPL